MTSSLRSTSCHSTEGIGYSGIVLTIRSESPSPSSRCLCLLPFPSATSTHTNSLWKRTLNAVPWKDVVTTKLAFLNKETKSFKDKKEAIKYAEMMNCSYRVLFEKSPKQDQFVWEIKVKEIKPIKVFNK